MPLATFETHRYELLDAAQRAREQETFSVPPEEVLADLPRYCAVKLVFRFSPKYVRDHSPIETKHGEIDHPNAERMWVIYRGMSSDGLLIGSLNNDPAFFPDDVLKLDDPVHFERRHIAAIQIDGEGKIVTYPHMAVC